jgi:hypothetical protein
MPAVKSTRTTLAPRTLSLAVAVVVATAESVSAHQLATSAPLAVAGRSRHAVCSGLQLSGHQARCS